LIDIDATGPGETERSPRRFAIGIKSRIKRRTAPLDQLFGLLQRRTPQQHGQASRGSEHFDRGRLKLVFTQPLLN
jgi:hypothetical protein